MLKQQVKGDDEDEKEQKRINRNVFIYIRFDAIDPNGYRYDRNEIVKRIFYRKHS